MRQIICSAAFVFCCHFCYGQSDGPKEITPQILQGIKSEVEKEVPAFKQGLVKQQLNNDEIEFALDTFRIEQIVSKRMGIDYSTMGINITLDEMTTSYDKLMNKYYNKLIQLLKPEDKQILITAQKAWLSFRDAEEKLIGTMTKDEYSGGGTIQSNIATDAFSEIVVKRTIDIFKYYEGVIKDK